MKLLVEIKIQLSRAAHLDGLGDHDRPGDDGKNDEADDDRLGFRRRLFPNINEFRLIGGGSRSGK